MTKQSLKGRRKEKGWSSHFLCFCYLHMVSFRPYFLLGWWL